MDGRDRTDAAVDVVVDVVVVGGGLAGLTAAATAAREGASVTLLEARTEPGGRARTEEHDGFLFNQGAHALYRAGAAIPILRELGVRFDGRLPRQRGASWVRDGELIPIRRLGTAGGAASIGVVGRLLSRSAARAARGRSFAQWLDQHTDDPRERDLAEMLVRTASYSADPTVLDAGAALDQVRRGAHGVLYLHGGWSTLVDGLRRAALEAGVRLVTGKVERLEPDGSTVTVHRTDGAPIRTRSVVVAAGGPAQVDALVDGASELVGRWATDARPVKAFALDVALAEQPRSRPLSVYGLGEPTYSVVHSATARLAPAGGALVHCLWYEPDLQPGVDHRARLEGILDQQQPGWRNVVVEVRANRRLVVAHDRPRPGVAAPAAPRTVVDDLPGVFVAGDWVTADGLLADAAVSSGRTAGRQAAAHASTDRPANRPVEAAR